MVSKPVVDAGPDTGEYIRQLDVILDDYYAARGYEAQSGLGRRRSGGSG